VKNEEEVPRGPERKITTPQEAAEMTRQRRMEFGLGERKELAPEELEESIEKLLGDLDQYDPEGCGPERQDEWYWTVQEARVGKDRELARAKLKRLLRALQEEAGK
jgi:hypothetical protein